MKNLLIAFVAGSILALATTNGANAQTPNNFASVDKRDNPFKFDKSVFPEASNTSTISASTVNTKALKNFKKSYKNAADEKWEKNDEGFTAEFTLNNIANMVFYDKKGNWEASIKNYHEDKFDRNVRAIVKEKYYDYKITYVQEIETAATLGTPTYMVHIEGDNDFKIIRVSDDAMDVYEEFGKQK